ncbi:hypothetical protein AAC387_Pa04g1771 [Persea americana]
MSELESSNVNENVTVDLLPEQETHIRSAIHNGIVFELFDHIEQPCGQAMDKNPASSMDRFITSLRGKMRRFKSTVEAAFYQYTETYNSSQSDEEKQLVFTPKHAIPKKPASKSPAKKKKGGRMPQPQQLNIDDSPLNASPLKNHVEEPKLHDEFIYVTPLNEDVSNWVDWAGSFVVDGFSGWVLCSASCWLGLGVGYDVRSVDNGAGGLKWMAQRQAGSYKWWCLFGL